MSEEEYIWCEYCDEYQVPKCETKDYLIKEFLEDLKLWHPMIGYKYTREELIEKWEKRKNE